VIACFVPLREEIARSAMKELSERINALMRKRVR